MERDEDLLGDGCNFGERVELQQQKLSKVFYMEARTREKTHK